MKAQAKNTEARFVGTNWEPEVKFQLKGRHTPKRKVVTTGSVRLNDCGIIDRAIVHLRQGKEVYIGDAIRLFPCMSTDLTGMQVIAQTLDEFRNKTLADMKAKITHHGEEIDTDEADERIRESREKNAPQEITPNMMVVCPECGAEFRVGRKLAK